MNISEQYHEYYQDIVDYVLYGNAKQSKDLLTDDITLFIYSDLLNILRKDIKI